MKIKPMRMLLAALVALSMTALPVFTASADGAAVYGPLTNNPNVNPRPYVDAKYYCIVVDKQTEVVSVLRRDANGKYTIIDRQFVCSTGKTPGRTPVGSFKISTKRRWLNSPSYHVREQFACRINGYIWIHSTCFTKYDPNALERESYTDLGRPVSAGCIRLTVRDAKWIYANCPAGTVIKIVKSGGPAAVCLTDMPALPDGATYDPTDSSVSH